MEALDRLIACLAKLPGVGRRSAERMAMKLVRNPDGMMKDLVSALEEAGRSVRVCSHCGNVTREGEDPCRLCRDPSRDDSLLCVVEDPNDILSIEKSGGYRGRYHALMARLSPMKGEGPADMRIEQLVTRVKEGAFTEVILALSTDVEGDSTAALISEHLKDKGVKVSRLAFGLPAGSGIMYSDPITLARAIRGRTGE